VLEILPTVMVKTQAMCSRTRPWKENLKCNKSNHTRALVRKKIKTRTLSSPTLAQKTTRTSKKTRMTNKSNRKLKMNHPTQKTRTESTFKPQITSIKKWPKKAKKSRMNKHPEVKKIRTKSKPKKKCQPLNKTVSPRVKPRMMLKKRARRKLRKLVNKR
jgi:hypothetical protein